MPKESGYRQGAGLISLSGVHDYSGNGREVQDLTVTVATSSTPVLHTNPKRIWALFINIGVKDVYLQFGQDAAIDTGIYLITAGGWCLINEQMPWTGEVNAIADTTPCTLQVLECSIQNVSSEPSAPANGGSSPSPQIKFGVC